jgi:hypothetical protein
MSNNSRIKAQFQVQKIGDDYETFSTEYVMEKGKDGTKTMVQKQVPSKGGYLFTMSNGSQIRLETLDQIKHFGLDTKPTLIDITTGEEVNEQGIPLSIANLVQGAVTEAMLPRPVAGDGGVESSIEALEKD